MRRKLMKNLNRNEIDLLVIREQLASLLAGATFSLVANSFLAANVVLQIWRDLPSEELLIWLATVLTINTTRLITVRWLMKRGVPEREPLMFLSGYIVGAMLAGMAWSGLLVIATIHQVPFQPAMIVTLYGLTAGAVVQAYSYRQAALALTLPIFAVHFVILIVISSGMQYFAVLNLALYAAFLVRAAFTGEHAFVTAVRLKHESAQMAASLKSANALATKAAQRLEHTARHDALTGLLNRSAFRQQFEQRLIKARNEDSEIVVMMIDLDRFKAINDTFGHAAGDEVLVQVSERLSTVLGPSDVVARLGGDEFALLMYRQEIDTEDRDVARRILELITQPIQISGRQVQVGTSIGSAHYPRDGHAVDELQIFADVALYAAKSDGRLTYRAFDEDLRAVTDARRVYELDLAAALEDGSIEVWFQPKVHYGSGRVCGLEALVRWHHPNHGWVPPPEIVQAAAATRQSQDLTRRVLQACCRMLRLLEDTGRADVVISFNVSPAELGRYALADMVSEELTGYGIEPGRLEVEITEESFYSGGRGSEDIARFAGMGVRVAVDDFGVAYSSFGALRHAHFDCIKIDRSFIAGIADKPEDRALVQAILAVARALGADAIAEGVETAEQATVLASMGCHIHQGYLYSRPMPAVTLMRWLTLRETEAEPDPRHSVPAIAAAG